MKVVHLITGLNVGGAEMMLYKLLSGMDRGRFRSVVVSLTDVGPVGRRIAELGVPVVALRMPRGRPTPGGLARLVRLLRRVRPDVLQTWMYHADLLGLLAAPWSGVRHVAWNLRAAHDSWARISRLNTWTFALCARLSRRPSVVVVNSVAAQTFHAARGYRPRRWAVLPNGFALDRFAPDPAARPAVRAELGLGACVPLIGLVARYDPMKDHATFLRAAAILAETHPDVHYVLAGRDVDPANPALGRLAATPALTGRVHLLGERQDVPRLMAALDIFALSSWGESFPNVIGEAMACGVPCVVTDVGDSAAIVGATGGVVPPRDPAALAAACAALLAAGPAARAALGQAARQRVRQHFALETIVRRYEALYAALDRI